MAKHAFYSAEIEQFLRTDTAYILAEMVKANPFDLTDLQRDAWLEEIAILKRELTPFPEGWLMLEFTIPRMGKRVDAVVISGGIVFLLEFKVGDSHHRSSTDNQVLDYALDLKNFHKASKDLTIVPISVPTAALPDSKVERIHKYPDGVCYTIRATQASDLLTVHFNIIQNYRIGGIMYNEEAYTIYQQAEAFKLAYERCMMCINQNGAIILPIPAMVNSAFSVELFLKAVIKERTGECRSHKLSDLFNRLPIEIQQEIMNETNHSDFETQIERFSDAFVDFRYIYEDIFKTKDLNLKFWEDFSSAIYKIVPTHIARKGAPLYIDPSIK